MRALSAFRHLANVGYDPKQTRKEAPPELVGPS